jgi:ABC-type nitrate/sulfonate/bicarbonate transport system ATPase subunit
MSQPAVQVVARSRGASSAGVDLDAVGRVLGGKAVLAGVDLHVAGHERVGIVGRSGAGKSTLLSLVAGLDEPDAGVVAAGGATTASGRLERCALMPQRDCLLPWRSALDNAALALENRGLPRREARRRAAPLFERLGLRGAEHLRPARLSGGMRQRVAFLRTLLADKPVLLLDEPFGALDAITRAELQEWLAGALEAEPRTVLLVTHDVEEALLLCPRVLVLAHGRVGAELDAALPRDAPRRELVTSPEFAELRERALEAIG